MGANKNKTYTEYCQAYAVKHHCTLQEAQRAAVCEEYRKYTLRRDGVFGDEGCGPGGDDKSMKPQHEAIYNAVVSYITLHGYPPTVREIGEAVGLRSTSSVYEHLKQMFELGILESDEGIRSPRAIRVPGYRYVRD